MVYGAGHKPIFWKNKPLFKTAMEFNQIQMISRPNLNQPWAPFV